ncbi:DUF1854 domain-containing protein [Cohnella sp. AR92]|uniref:DUF1854 domain-containing protein n=1 Tax=Cohnella sp. AR92 TaxID=648716 RepID=UPI00131515DA|nr:DUF1854 domain-containing protein [Cohnella sp. AR92]
MNIGTNRSEADRIGSERSGVESRGVVSGGVDVIGVERSGDRSSLERSAVECSWITAESIRFRREEGGSLRAEWGSRAGYVRVRRLFPLSSPDSAIWIGDRSGSEWGVLRSLAGLEPASQAALAEELRLSPFLPRIARVVSLQRRFGEFRWTAESDAGEIVFHTGPLYESVTALPGGERVVIDRNEQRYVLPEDRVLDSKTRKKLAKWL